MRVHNISDLLDEEKELVKIVNSYGLLERIKEYYYDKFKVLFPKTVLPVKTHFDENVEKLLKLVTKKIK